MLLGLKHADLPLDMDQDPTQPLFDRERLEQGLLIRSGYFQVTRDQIGQTTGVVDSTQDLQHDLFGESRLLSQLGGALPDLPDQALKRRVRGVGGSHLLGLPHHRLETPVALGDPQRNAPMQPFQQKLHHATALLHLADARHRTDGVQHVGVDVLDVLALHHRKHQAILALGHGLDRPQGRGPAGPDRHRHAGVQQSLAQGKNWKSSYLGHLSALILL